MTNAFAAFSPTTPLAPHTITRPAPGPTDVAIDITYCGVCHSDLHFVRCEWGEVPYPAIPGHEIVGRVTAVGSAVTKHKVGDVVGVGCLGGLGHMGVKIAAAMGAEVIVFTTSPGKAEEARALGASDVVISTDPDQMQKYAGQLQFILDTVAASHDLDPLINCLKRDGTLCLVGAPSTPHPSPNVMGMIFSRRNMAGSLIGGLPETQERLDFCGTHGITATIELIPMQEINDAYERMRKSDVTYRFVIDMASLK